MTEEANIPTQFTQLSRAKILRKIRDERNNEKIKMQRIAWYYKNHDKCLKRMTEYRETHREYLRAVTRLSRVSMRKLLFRELGDKCVHCGFSDVRGLQFDHIKYIGRKNRLSTNEFYYRYAKNIELARKELQVLCANCNVIKRVELGEN